MLSKTFGVQIDLHYNRKTYNFSAVQLLFRKDVKSMSWGSMGTDREERINYDRMRNYRLERMKKQMKKDGIGALLSFDAWTVRYLSGAYVTIPTRWIESQAVVLPKDGDPYVFGGGSGVPYRMRNEMPWLKRKVYGMFGMLKILETKEDFKPVVEAVSKILEENGVKDEPLGIEGCSSQLILSEAFKDAGITIVDARHTVQEARKIKNKDEIECVRMASAMAEAAFEDMRQAIKPGIKECALVGIGMKKLYELGADECQEFVCISGPLTNPWRIDYTDRIIRPGDLIIIDVNGASFNGYKTCYYRTFSCGRPTAEQKEIYDICRDMLNNGLSAVKPGNTTLDICEKWPTDPSFWGYESWQDAVGLALGHGLGLSLHEKPFISYPVAKRNPEKLEPGMVIAVETWYGKWGGRDAVRLEDVVAVTETGYDLLTVWPKDELTVCWTG